MTRLTEVPWRGSSIRRTTLSWTPSLLARSACSKCHCQRRLCRRISMYGDQVLTRERWAWSWNLVTIDDAPRNRFLQCVCGFDQRLGHVLPGRVTVEYVTEGNDNLVLSMLTELCWIDKPHHQTLLPFTNRFSPSVKMLASPPTIQGLFIVHKFPRHSDRPQLSFQAPPAIPQPKHLPALDISPNQRNPEITRITVQTTHSLTSVRHHRYPIFCRQHMGTPNLGLSQ